MMRELVVCTKQVEGEEGDAVRYRYSILIDELMELLTRNSVTPAGLRDVVEDWL